MSTLKSIGSTILGSLLFVGAILAFVLVFALGTKLAFKILPVVNIVAALTFIFNLVIILPMIFVRRTRATASIIMFVSSYVFGLATWLSGFAVTLTFLGLGWLIVGLFLGGVGVVPLGIIGAGVHGQWLIAGALIINFTITVILRMISLWAAESAEHSSTNLNHDDFVDIDIYDKADTNNELEDWDKLKVKG